MTHLKVLYMSSETCQPCKQLRKSLPHLAHALDTIATVEYIDVATDVRATELNIRTVPTFVITQNDVEVMRYIGVTSLAVIEQRVKDIITTEISSGR